MTAWLKNVWHWFDRRLGIRSTLEPILLHPVPSGAGWWYVFGSVTLALFLLQVVTGITLLLVYAPTADNAYASLEHLNYDYTLGWLLRAMHFIGSSGMVVMMTVHLVQVFLFGAFKYPRELTWLAGVGLFACTLGMAFTGQVLRWDSDGYWALGVGAAMLGRIPGIGEPLIRLVLGGPTVGAASLSRIFTLHVFVILGLLIAFLALHLYLIVKQGISAPPTPGKPADPATYHKEYEEELRHGVPFFPLPFFRDAVAAGGTVLAVVIVAAIVGPKGPGLPPDPTIIHVEPRPDWPFLPLFALLALSPLYLEKFLMLGLPLLILAVLIAVPLLASRGERSARRRPVAVLSIALIGVSIAALEWLSFQSPWSPHMLAWSGTPVPPAIVEHLVPEQLAGAATLQVKTCRNCHALEGKGGLRGPDLTYVGARLTRPELVRQVIQGGGNMPPFGNQLTTAEVEALVSFLSNLQPSLETRPRAPSTREGFPEREQETRPTSNRTK